jgi:hypothetical protein
MRSAPGQQPPQAVPPLVGLVRTPLPAPQLVQLPLSTFVEPSATPGAAPALL